MIFADGNEGAIATGIAVGGSIFAGLWALLANRDKLKYDAKLLTLEAANKECLEDRQSTAVKVIALETRGKELETKYERCMEHHAANDEQNGKLWAAIAELKGV